MTRSRAVSGLTQVKPYKYSIEKDTWYDLQFDIHQNNLRSNKFTGNIIVIIVIMTLDQKEWQQNYKFFPRKKSKHFPVFSTAWGVYVWSKGKTGCTPTNTVHVQHSYHCAVLVIT